MSSLLHIRAIFLPSHAAFPLRRGHPHVEAIREIFMPALRSTMTEGKIVSWIKSEGDKLYKGESVVVVESSKADMDIETFYDGYLVVIIVYEGNRAPVASAIFVLEETEDEIPLPRACVAAASSSSPAAAAPAPTPPASNVALQAVAPAPPLLVAAAAHPTAEGGRVIATPYTKKLAKDLNVQLAVVAGTGSMGRIVAKDVEGAAAGLPQPAVAPAPADVELGSDVLFTAMQGAVSRNIVESLMMPTFPVGYTITTDALDALYKKIKSKGVTMTELLSKATALALEKHPVINSSCRVGRSFTYNSSINIAVTVVIDGELITPALQDANKVDIYSLSRKWKELVDKARAKKLQPS